jgi:hypothetical protein
VDKVRLDTEKLAPGMKLGEPIIGANGVTLMPSGIRLTPMFIARIRKGNIARINVYVDKRPDDATDVEETPGHDRNESGHAPAGSGGGRPRHDTAVRLSRDQQDFIRSVATEVSRVFVNVMENPLMAQLRAATIKRLVMHGPDGVVNRMRRGDDCGEEDADGS